jgi:hypothetical protein
VVTLDSGYKDWDSTYDVRGAATSDDDHSLRGEIELLSSDEYSQDVP